MSGSAVALATSTAVAVVVGAIVVAAIVVGAVALLRLPDRSRRGDSDRGPDFDPDDTADIAARLEAIGSEHARGHGRKLEAVVQQLVDRRVPVRAVEVVAGIPQARIRFADGTTVLARGDHAGDLGVLAGVIRECSATAAGCGTDATGTHVVFAWLGMTRRLSVTVVGVDQPT